MKKIRLKKGLITQKVNNKINIFNGEKSVIYSLNNSASFIFEHIKLRKEKKEIIDLLIKRYKIPSKIAEKDYEEFILELKKKHISS